MADKQPRRPVKKTCSFNKIVSHSKIFLNYSLYVKKICLFSSLFGDCDVDFWLDRNSAEVNLVYFCIFSIFRMFSAFKKYYLILKFRFTPRIVVKKYHFWTANDIVKFRPLL